MFIFGRIFLAESETIIVLCDDDEISAITEEVNTVFDGNDDICAGLSFKNDVG